ncbi:MAG: hypothetical protein ACR2KJ_17790 [Jatrophihabitans sp.]
MHFLILTQWSLVPDSIKSIGTYLRFEIPAKITGQPFEPAQKLACFVVIFLLGPLQIARRGDGAVGARAIPVIRQAVRRQAGSAQPAFLGMCGFGAFIVVHVFMVIIHGVPEEFAAIVLGDPGGDRRLAPA